MVLTGSAAEFRRCRFIARSAHVPIDAVLSGKTDLAELTAVVSSARALVCGDTGMAHIATALRTPSVVLFGPDEPAVLGSAGKPAVPPRVVARPLRRSARAVRRPGSRLDHEYTK